MHRRNDSTLTCAAATTCGACTPILGCGWCQYEDGTGSCATGPSACTKLAFRWNWEPTDCPASPTPPPTDAGVTPVDSGTAPEDAVSIDAAEASIDAAETSADATETSTACVIPAAASASCAVTTGGTLCPADRYTLGCHGTTPDAALGCTKAYGTSTESYYCCPCGG